MNEQDMWDTYFGLAAAGYIASFAGYDPGETTMATPEEVADYAAKCADAMMAERRKRIEKRAAEPHPDNARCAAIIRKALAGGWFDIEDISGEDDHEVLTALCDRLEGKR